MIRVIAICAFVGLLMSLGAIATREAAGQRFPYEAPQAPEFDDNGNLVESASVKPPRSDYRPQRARPMAPRTPLPASSSRPPSIEREHPQISATAAPPNVPIPPQQVPVQQPQEPPDCTQFPSLIATAQAPNQMQWYARQYLTCLLKRGWRMPQAREEVIRIIEASRRGGR